MVAVTGHNKEKRHPSIDATAGAFAGAVARFVVGPLDVLKIRFQVQVEPIIKKHVASVSTAEAAASKYTGIKQAAATIFREEGIQVGETLRLEKPRYMFGMLTLAASNPIMTVAAVLQTRNTYTKTLLQLIMTDIDNVSNLMAWQSIRSRCLVLQPGLIILAAVQHFLPALYWLYVAGLKINPVQGLWRGTVPGLLLQVPYTAVQFVALQQFRAWATRTGLDQTEWTHTVSFGSGAFAGAAATVGSYPFDLLRTTLAAQGEPKVSSTGLTLVRPTRYMHSCHAGIFDHDNIICIPLASTGMHTALQILPL